MYKGRTEEEKLLYFETFFVIHFGLGIMRIEKHVIRKQVLKSVALNAVKYRNEEK